LTQLDMGPAATESERTPWHGLGKMPVEAIELLRLPLKGGQQSARLPS
jgi:hypothetical protein